MEASAKILIPISATSYAAAIEGLTRLNQHVMGSRPFPPLYQSGIRYRRESQDVWRHAGDVLRDKWGDCEDLAAYRSAELRLSGEDNAARVGVYQTGPRRYHAIVIRGDGSTEDPSRVLGMRTAQGRQTMYVGDDNGDPVEIPDEEPEEQAQDDMPEVTPDMPRAERRAAVQQIKQAKKQNRSKARRLVRFVKKAHRRALIPGVTGAWIGMGDDPMPNCPQLTFDLYRSGQGWSGIVRLPLNLSSGGAAQSIVAKTSPSMSKGKAAGKAMNMAARMSSNPLIQSVVPPQAAAAMKVLNSPVGKLASRGGAKLLKRAF